ncbi:glycosyltransferase family 2 protein [Seonamhaeicola maritimus]|uniref:glycosyltransferase family 2 protein n=1 Tax=Seonamhaeicola maritimus TaxID=2591822 RepID=UPI002494107C|nr:glycosyltransferase family 2 protein [Seonamhaeicola maritimus]
MGLLLSIITVNFNDSKGLEKTVKSVRSQNYTNFEHIIIDGNSTDGSKQVIEKHKDSFGYWVSEPDSGIYNAMNKGVEKAKGDYLLFLNSGDYFINRKIIQSFASKNTVEDIVYGKIKWKKGKEIWDGNFSDKLTFKYFSKASLPHQGSFIKRNLFKEIGNYDEKLKIVSDWKFFVLAIYKYNCSFKRIDIFISVCNRDGLSCLPGNWSLILKEREQTLTEYFPSFYSDLAVYNDDELKLKNKIISLEKKQKFLFCTVINKIFK